MAAVVVRTVQAAAHAARSVQEEMKYQTTFKHLRLHIGFLAALSVGMAVVAILVGSVFPGILGGALLAYLLAVRFIRTMTFAKDKLEFNGIVKRWSIGWQDITGLKRMRDYGWPIDRMFGDSTYEIHTVHGRKIVSFLFFPGACLRELKTKIGPNHGLQADAPQAPRL